MKNEVIAKEVKNIAIGTIALDVVMVLVFFIIKKFSLGVIIGAIIGSIFAIGNFAYLGYCIQKAMEKEDGARAYLNRTYIVRMFLHAACIILAVLLPFENTIAGIVPLFFPRLVIYIMQILGMYKPEKENKK